MTAIELITKERQEQLEKHGMSIKNDVQHNSVGCSYDGRVMPLVCGAIHLIDPNFDHVPAHWNKVSFEHTRCKLLKERLIVAAALLAAEIDRLQFIENQEKIKK